MPLRDELKSQGDWLFRWRSYLPVLLLPLVFLDLRDFRYPLQSARLDRLWESFCLLVSMSGLAVRAVTVGYAPKGTSGRNTREQIAETVNTCGIYSVVRHPLYVGNYLMWLGIALFPRSWQLPLIVTLVFWVYYERIMIAEESFLEGKFGKVYREWAERTPAFVPRLRQWRPPTLSFSFRNVLQREFSGFFAVILIFTAMEVVGDRIVYRRWVFDAAWMVTFGVSLAIYLVLRTLKRRTRLLRVEGR